MNKLKAHVILNQLKIGFDFSQNTINEALLATGDLDVFRTKTTLGGTLRIFGNEPSDSRSREIHCQADAVRRIGTVVRYWVADKRAH